METILANISILVQAPVFNIQLLLDGLLIGGVFALAAYGLALVWGVMNVKNLAQGDFVIMGGYVTWVMAGLGIHPLLTVPFAAAAIWLFAGGLYGTVVQRTLAQRLGLLGSLGAITAITFAAGFIGGVVGGVTSTTAFLGLVPALHKSWMFHAMMGSALVVLIAAGGLYGTIIRWVLNRDLFVSLLATFGISIVIAQMLNIYFTSDTQTADAGFTSLLLFDGLVTLPQVKLIGFLLAAALGVAVILFMKRSRMGQAIRATAQDARAARVMGIDTERVYGFTFALNGAICGAAGSLIVMIWVIQPFFGITYSIRSFVVVVAAGLGNLPGVIAAGLGMGVIEQFGGFILGAEFQQAIVVGLLLCVLMYRQMMQARKRQVVQ